MDKKRVFLAGLILSGISLAFGINWKMRGPHMKPAQTSIVKWNILNPGKQDELKGISITGFIDQATFDRGWNFYRFGSRPVACDGALGGVVNHHVLALDVLVHFFVESQRCRPHIKTVIIISPDHYLVGTSPITTHEERYLSYGKTVEVDGVRLVSLRREIPSLKSDATLFFQEHGVGALVPFVSKIWPEAKIIPFVIRSDIDRKTSEKFADWLRQQVQDPNVFILVSSDMSHYLEERTALKNDEQTERAFHLHDEGFFWRATDDFTDNGRGISSVMRALQSNAWVEQGHGISTRYQGSPGFTTSYLTGFWR